ncbi:MAG: nickel insertion protein, partial [Thermoleophilia bacterium]
MILYLDCASGASGDMLTAALLAATAGDAGPAGLLDAVVRPALAAVGVDPAVVSLRAVRRGGFAAFAFEVAAGPGFATMA